MNRIDFDRAFPQTPDCVGEAIRLGFLRGARTAARRRRVAGMLSVAAALVILLGAALFSMSRIHQPKPDLLPLSRPNCSPTPVPSATITPEPTAAVTPEPTATVTPEPTDTPAPVNEEAAVYCTEGGKYYHSEPNCSGMQGASGMSIEKAEAMGKTACPVCIGDAVFATESGVYYHTPSYINCPGLEGASAMTVEKAEAMGKKPCPVCIESWVFCTQGGVCFHKESDCSGMKGASLMSIAEARALGKAPCSDCFLPAALASIVYASYDAPGSDYHSVPDCGGQSLDRALTMEQALAEGYGVCPDCAWNPLTLYASAAVTEAEDGVGVVYYTPGGVYYHLAEDCSGMQNASAHSIATANADGKLPCPSCFGESVSWVQLTDGALTVYSSSEEINAEISINNR